MFASPASSSSSSSSSGASSSTSPSSYAASPTKTRSPAVHAASLVDPASHSPALMQLISIKLSRPVIDYIVDCVSETVDFAMGRLPPSPPSASSPSRRGRSPPRTAYQAKFASFVSTVLSRAEVTPPTVLTALVYVHRARPHLSIALEEWALERVWLGALISASKYTNDSTLKNVHWALCTGVFGKRDVGRIEREFLDVLDWELGVSESDLLAHHAGLAAALGAREQQQQLAAPRPRTHARKPSVPELEPSSPLSSAASMSPRTPASRSVSPPHHPHHSAAHKADVPMDVDAPAHPSAHKGGKFHDLLRAFPLPRSHHHHQQGRVAIHVAA
ncbi:hypothetical protein FB451DRAFT_1373843 [Mycena latifolia]|nr:hypothetical protein FB451DRAFT_1373843 [Mycena latifolia]